MVSIGILKLARFRSTPGRMFPSPCNYPKAYLSLSVFLYLLVYGYAALYSYFMMYPVSRLLSLASRLLSHLSCILSHL